MERNPKSARVFRSFKEALTHALGTHVREIVLFGSRARGEARPDSDYDLLVVVDRVSPQVVDLIDEIAGRTLLDHGAVIAAFPIGEEDRARRRHSPLLTSRGSRGSGCMNADASLRNQLRSMLNKAHPSWKAAQRHLKDSDFDFAASRAC